MKQRILWTGVAIVFFLFSCNNEENLSGKTLNKITDDTLPNPKPKSGYDLAEFRFNKIIANVPSPVEVMREIHDAGLKYNRSLMCPLNKALHHKTEAAMALNCGIYMVDIAYQACFLESQIMMNYLGIAHRLANDVNASEPFDRVLNKRLEHNLHDEDSLVAVVEEGLNAMEDYLINNKRLITATQIMTGAWVESNHLMFNTIIDSPESIPHAANFVFEQRVHLDNIMELLHEFKDDAGLVDEHQKLIVLHDTFGKIHSEEDVTIDLLIELAHEITEIRHDIVGM